MMNLKAEDLTLVNKSFISSDYEECESDIVYTAKLGDNEAIFLLDQKITPKEFLDRVKSIALFFNNLSDEELKAIKH